jgi:transcriptional regulator with GAF, ATPase, and Fis domain
MNLGDVLNGRYKLVRRLGSGGMGEVFLAHDLIQDGKEVALKALNEGVKTSYLQYFKHEFKALCSLSHPNLAPVYDFGQIEGTGRPFFTSEYVRGQSLLRIARRLSFEETCNIVVQICRALDYIHNRGLIHHDIKPDNILVEEGSEQGPPYRVKLIDFGLVGRSRRETSSTVPGTIYYIAPEIFLGRKIDRRSDLYSLGVLLYQVSTGVLPFEGATQMDIIRGHLEETPTPVSKLRPDVPQGLVRIISRLIAKEPSERYAGAKDVIRAINEISDSEFELETKAVREGYILSGKFVGRDAESNLLLQTLASTVGAGSGFAEARRLQDPDLATTATVEMERLTQRPPTRPFVLITGETGIGKARLLNEFKYHVQLNQIPFYQGTCASGRGVGLGPLVEILRQLCGTEEGMAAAEGLQTELVKILPEFRERFGVAPSPPLEARQERLRLIDSAAKFLFRVAESRPFVMALTGLQWADELTLAFVGYLARTLSLESGRNGNGDGDAGDSPESPRILAVGTLAVDQAGPDREGALAELGQEGYLHEVALHPLEKDDVTSLVRSMLGMERDPQILGGVIHRKTDGNPFFVEELMKTLVEEEILYREAGEWHVKGESIEDIDIPSSVAQVLTRRLERLDPLERAVLNQVAVFAGPATLDAVAAALGLDGADVYPRLDALAGLDILDIFPLPGGRDSGYDFRHASLKALVYDAMETADCEAIHLRTGQALEKLFADELDEHVEEVARHFLRARDAEHGVLYGLQAGKKAKTLCANQQALDFYTRAIALSPDQDREVLEEVGGLLALTGDFDGAIAQFTSLLTQGEASPGDLARLHRLRGETCRKKGDLEAAVDYLNEGILSLGVDATRHVEGVKILSLNGFFLVLRGDFPAATRCLVRALRSAHRLGARKEYGTIYNFLGHVYFMRSQHPKALRAYQKSLAHSEACDYAHGIAAACDSLGNTYRKMGNFSRALEYNLRSQKIRKQMGDIFLLADSLNNIGVLYVDSGDLQKAMDYERECLAVRERIGDDLGKSVCHLNLGIVYQGLEMYAEAIKSFNRRIAIRRKFHDRVGQANALNNIGIIYRITGDLDQAIDGLEESLALNTELGMTEGIINALASLGQVYAEIGHLQKAKELLRRGLTLAQENDMRLDTGVAYSILGEVARVERDWEEGEKFLKRSLDVFRELGASDWICFVDLTYSMLCTEIGQFDRARQYVREALGIAKNLGIKKVRTNALLIQGVMESELGREAEALEMLGEARDNAETAGNRELLWKIHHALGNLYRDMAKFETAERHYKTSISLVEAMAALLKPDLARCLFDDRRRKKLYADFQTLQGRMMETRQEINLSQKASLKGRITDLENLHTQLLKLLEINQNINSEHNLDNLLDLIMDSVVELSEAERGFLLLMEEDRMEVKVARNINREEIDSPEFNISHSIAKQVIESGVPINLTNAQEDERFSRFHSVLDLHLRSVLCFPFKLKERVIGAMYVDNRFQRGIFSEKVLSVLSAFGDQAAIAIENARLYEENLKKTQKIEALNERLEEKLVVTSAKLAEARERIDHSQREFELRYNYDSIIGRDTGMKKVLKTIDRVLDKNIPVLIQGESGTGKELIARAVHFNSPRRNERFVSENCAAISASLLESELFGYDKGAFTGAEQDKKGLFEVAHRGTLFLDEIGDMSLEMQAKLLRVLQDGQVRRVGGTSTIKVDVRILSATNQELVKLVAENKFREDLFYRISTVSVTLPPLRERRQDIPIFLEHFLSSVCKEQGVQEKEIDKEVLSALVDYDWPGNVRELLNEVTRLVTLGDSHIRLEDISPRLREATTDTIPLLPASDEGRPLKRVMAEIEKSILIRALEKNRWNKTKTARELGLSRVALHKKIAKYEMK